MFKEGKTYKHIATIEMVMFVTRIHWDSRLGQVLDVRYFNTQGASLFDAIDLVLVKSTDYKHWKEWGPESNFTTAQT